MDLQKIIQLRDELKTVLDSSDEPKYVSISIMKGNKNDEDILDKFNSLNDNQKIQVLNMIENFKYDNQKRNKK